MCVLELFYSVDDFMLSFAHQLKTSHLAAGKQRERAGQLCPSEVMTILIHFHQSGIAPLTGEKGGLKIATTIGKMCLCKKTIKSRWTRRNNFARIRRVRP